MNRRQLGVGALAVLALVASSLAAATFASAVAGTTSGVSSGVFVDENVTLADQPDPSSLNLSQIPWLQAYYRYFESGNESAPAGAGGETKGSTSLFPLLVAAAVGLVALLVGLVVWVWWLLSGAGGIPDPPAPSTAGDDEAEADTGRETPDLGVAPSNEVYRAWNEMVDRIAVPDGETRTPRELATLAVEAGLDPEAVRTLTRQFERVRYGRATATPDRESRASELLDRLEESS